MSPCAADSSARSCSPAPTGRFPGGIGEVAFTSTQDGGGSPHLRKTATRSSARQSRRVLVGDRHPAEVFTRRREIVFTRAAPGLTNTATFAMSSTGGQVTALTNTPRGNSDPGSIARRDPDLLRARARERSAALDHARRRNDVREIRHDTQPRASGLGRRRATGVDGTVSVVVPIVQTQRLPAKQ